MSTSIEVITGATVQVTESEVTITVQSGQPGISLPAGGSTGQVLSKASAAAYDYAWVTAGGSVTSVTAGTGLTGGTITGAGTIAADFGTAAGKVCEGNDARLSDARTPTAHTHAQGDVTGLVTALSSKVPQSRLVSTGAGLLGGGDLTGNLLLDVDWGTGAGKVCQGNDSRLSDSRAPTGSAGGDLAGTYPNPTIGTAKVTTATIEDGAVTLAKLTPPAAASKLLGSPNPNTGVFTEITLGSNLSMSGGTLSATSGGFSPVVTDFTSSGSYTLPAGSTMFRVTAIGGGGGGGGGYQAAAGNLRAGGGGGGGGGYSSHVYAVSDVGGSGTTLTVTIGGAGGGGAGGTAGAGNNGTGGGTTTVTYGSPAANVANATGGTAGSAGAVAAGGAAGSGGSAAQFAGAGGTAGGTAGAPTAGTRPNHAASGGAGGGGVTAANAGFGGGTAQLAAASVSGATLAGGASGATGTAGTAGTSWVGFAGGGGSGGGGGTTNQGGDGGAGGARGGGGGGGAGGTTAGGAGGSGGAGFVRIEVW